MFSILMETEFCIFLGMTCFYSFDRFIYIFWIFYKTMLKFLIFWIDLCYQFSELCYFLIVSASVLQRNITNKEHVYIYIYMYKCVCVICLPQIISLTVSLSRKHDHSGTLLRVLPTGGLPVTTSFRDVLETGYRATSVHMHVLLAYIE